MAFRFQRRMRIAPGLRLNLSKRGVGFSVGPRGSTVSVGRRGIFGHAGLPGSGLSYREKLNKKGMGTGGSRARTKQLHPLEETLQTGGAVPVRVVVEDSGEIVFQDDSGTPYSDDEIRIIKRYAENNLRDRLGELVDRLNEDLEHLDRVHHETPAPRDEPVFEAREFEQPKPIQEPMLPKGIWCKLWPPAARKVDAINEFRTRSYREALDLWEKEKAVFDKSEAERKIRETIHVHKDLNAMATVLAEHLESIPWPRETEIDFDLGENSKTIAIDIDLPTEEAFPAFEWSMPAKQIKLTRKALNATRRREIYRDYVHAAALRVLGEVFRRLPTVQVAMVSAYTQIDDTSTGSEKDAYLYSVIVKKADWKRIKFGSLEKVAPVDALAAFELKRKMSKTGVFKEVEPFTLEDLEAATNKV